MEEKRGRGCDGRGLRARREEAREKGKEKEEGGKQVRKRDTLPVTGGKDLGKRKGVAIDYLTPATAGSGF